MKLFKGWVPLLIALCFSIPALAQVYPINNPTYIPTAIAPPQTFTTTGDYTYSASGISTVTIRVSGTCTGLTAAPQGTNDGTNWTTVQAIPVAGGGNVTSITGTGFWRVNAAGFTKTRLHITVLSASCTVAMAGTMAPGNLYIQNPTTVTGPISIQDSTATYYMGIDSNGIVSTKITNGTQTMPTMDAVARPGFIKITDGTNLMPTMDVVARKGFMQLTDGTSAAGVTAASTAAVAATPALVVAQSPNGADPCANPNVAKSSVALAISTATTTKVVALTSSQVIYVCGFSASMTGTAPTMQFVYGTNVSAECDTGATNLTGAYIPTSGAYVQANAPMTMFKTAASKDLCIITTGTSPAINGVMTYVKQ